MGQVLPLQPDLLLSPEMRGLIGHVAVEGVAREVPVARQISVAPLVDGLGVTGVLERGDGAVEQRFGFLALPDGRVIYVDRLALVRDARPTLLHLGTLGVLNDVQWPFHDGSRNLFFAGGEREFLAAQAATEPAAEQSSPWFNVDGMFGIVRLAASGPAVYTPAPTNAAGRLEQRFNLSVVPASALAAARPGERLAQGVFVFYPNQTAEQTAAAASRCTLLSAPEESQVRLQLEDGLVVAFDLAALSLQLSPSAPAAPSAAEVDALAARVARHHLSGPRLHHADSWMRAVFYSGLLALEGAEWEEPVREICDDLKWRPKHRVYHADDHTIGQSYVELFRRRQDPAMIAPLRARFDYILAHPFMQSLDRSETLDPHAEWSWCDALYMSPPTWAGLARVTGEAAYLDFALAGWWKSSDFLYDRDTHLFHRDSNTMTHREPNGEKVFWGRGNGWVVAGLVRLLEQMPAGHPGRAPLEQQLREMAAALVRLQPVDGLWRSSLLDPASYPVPETSGSGLICYALAWGINHGVLDRATYLPATLRAWQGLAGCVTPEGRLTHVQAIGAAPTNFDSNATEDYGVGAVLLAASEVRRLGTVH
jgi:rhamnogalacturonyl hydrolase YesR